LASAKRRTDAAMALMMAVGRVQASDADTQPDIPAFLTDPLFA
jgi:phage terminase large subunit-like protein